MGVIRLTTVGANGQIEEEIVAEAWDGVGEGILAIAVITTVDSLREVNLVEQFIVEINTDESFFPVHAPDVELIGPVWILVGKMCEGDDGRVPHGLPSFIGTPAGIGENRWLTVFDIVFHHVYFTILRPLPFVAQKPDSRPGS